MTKTAKTVTDTVTKEGRNTSRAHKGTVTLLRCYVPLPSAVTPVTVNGKNTAQKRPGTGAGLFLNFDRSAHARDLCGRDIQRDSVTSGGVTATGRYGRKFVWTGLVPYQKANGHGTYLAQWNGTCATCGDAFEVLTPIGVLADGKHSKALDLANCPAHRGHKKTQQVSACSH